MDGALLALECAGLQLLPENAGKAVRLMHVAALATTTSTVSDRRPLSSSRLRRILSHPEIASLGRQEDPYDDVWIKNICFYGGNFLVSTGHLSGSPSRLQALLDACMASEEELPSDFLGDAYRVAQVLLRLSDVAIRGAGLHRGQTAQEGHGKPIIIPGNRRREEVTFLLSLNKSTLQDLLGRDLLEPMVIMQGTRRTIFKENPTDDELIVRPFLDQGEVFVLTSPLDLSASIIFHIARLAQVYQCADKLDTALKARLWTGVSDALVKMGAQATSRIPEAGAPQVRSYSLVDDYSLTCAMIPSLTGAMNLKDPFGASTSGTTAVAALLSDFGVDLNDSPKQVILVLQESLGESAILGLESDAPSNIMLTNIADVDAICTLVHHPLTLHRFIRALRALEKSTFIMSFSSLDTFAIYRAHRDSFYLSDDRRPDTLSVTP